ncbi:MAG: tryptophan--tRNA ligase [Candidatus Nealsonbacteria bacterium CG09_land_8_20_14_0_10_42_14]|uniref:Tryptophan--tRNA ligase n=1 Tax=Candidatus Nealsonbacteria bacterium CG09_land_8_20_14_0_10_42_14 TaxID=1974707 RepID=A0A2H0WXQ8_9BACT|nr:MAG: tryptophan--tRNA ligase [Candidatus Nealsonbacteria bacterium CG09_land_8_20_14_0_10_42_14]
MMRILSGIAPSGQIHIGNYLGAIKQWKELQEMGECIFFIADLHALTIPRDPKTFAGEMLQTATELLAAGLDPEKCIIFIQSQIKEHTELCWLLNTLTPIGELERMTQYKEKSKQFKQNINAGLLDYPVLQAADILLYQTDSVPVGKDQVQHLELTKTIARKFNQKYGKAFKVPEALTLETGAKIMALSNPKKKMSKSSPETCLFLFDEPEIIKKKIMSAVTDPGKSIKYNPAKKPGISNLLAIYSLFSDKSISQIEKKFSQKGYAEFKKSLAELLILKLEPFRRKKKELMNREVYVKEILEQGRKRAEIIAQSTMADVRKKMGLI